LHGGKWPGEIAFCREQCVAFNCWAPISTVPVAYFGIISPILSEALSEKA